MKCIDIVSLMHRIGADGNEKEKSSTEGLILGRGDKSVSKILITAGMDSDTVDYAIKHQADMIISHEQLIKAPISAITGGNYLGRMLIRLISNDISCYCTQSEYELGKHNISSLAAAKLGIDEASAEHTAGCCFGRLLEPASAKDICDMVMKRLGADSVRLYLPEDKADDSFSELAVAAHLGAEELNFIQDRGVDIVLAGDLSTAQGRRLKNMGITAIDVSSEALDSLFVEYAEQYLAAMTTSDIELLTMPLVLPYKLIQREEED